MPLPEPRNGESEAAFRDRCMGDEVMVREFEDSAQRYRVCQAQWSKRARAALLPGDLVLRAEAGSLEIAAAEGEDKGLRRFTMQAYTGGAMSIAGWPYPVVIDLAGLRIPARSRPILKDHSTGQIVGHTNAIEKTESLLNVSGVVSGAGEAAREVIASSDNGFPWQASVGARVEKVVFIPAGRSARANGKEFKGPLYVARKSTLGELSFVALGADDATSAKVAASAAGQKTEVYTMSFEEWVQAQGFVLADLDEKQTASLKAAFERENAPEPQAVTATAVATEDNATEPQQAPEPDAGGDPAPAEVTAAEDPDPVAEIRAEVSRDLARIAAIRKTCGEDHAEIAARAIGEGWSAEKTELEVLRASRPQAPAVVSGSQPASADVLECAACLSAGIGEDAVHADYGDRVMEAARPMRNIGLRELVAECARLEGMSVPRVFGDGAATIRAGFSTISLPGILENVMNKTMLAAYEATPIAAFELCSVGSVTDFKEITRYRLLGTGGFEKVAADGELKHGKLGEQKYKNQADTYGQILMLTRKDIINDDLNAFLDIPRQMGRSGAESIDDLFFSLLLSNPGGFFAVGNGNYVAGADTAFGPDSLTAAKTLFRKQKAGPGSKAKDQKPINIRPELLVVPVELETEAELLMGSAQLMMDSMGAKTKIPVDNPHRNKYRVVSAPHLSDDYYGGASGKAWYLFANPNVLPAFEIVFLNGRRQPTIERISAAPNTLGVGFRAYIDVGVTEQDPRGAVRLKGEA